MSLARAWTRQLIGASGAAMLVPGTVACELAVLALAGGSGALATLADGVVAAGTSVTSRVPGPVGSLATQTLESVGAAVDKILPLEQRTSPE